MKNCALLYFGLPNIKSINFRNHKKFVIDNNKDYHFDIFIHFWKHNNTLHKWLPNYQKSFFETEDNILNEIKPTSYKFENPIDFTKKEYEQYIGPGYYYKWNILVSDITNQKIIYDIISLYYSISQSNNLRLEYQKKNNVKYDKIIIIDKCSFISTPININNYNKSFHIYSRDWNYPIPKEFPERKNELVELKNKK